MNYAIKKGKKLTDKQIKMLNELEKLDNELIKELNEADLI